MSNGFPPEGGVQNGNTEQIVSSSATIGLSEGATAAAAFVDFQETINLVKEQLMGASEEGEVRSFEDRVRETVWLMLSTGTEGGDPELPDFLEAIQQIAWFHVQQQLFGSEEGGSSELQRQLELVLSAAIENLINASGDQTNALKNMNENINKLIHGLHILGDNVVPHLEKSLVEIQMRIAKMEGEGIEPKDATNKARTSSSTGGC